MNQPTDVGSDFQLVPNPTMSGRFDGEFVWPLFVRGEHFLAAFPERAPVPVTSSLSSLALVGFPPGIIDAWAGAIPSLNALQISAINDFNVLEGSHLVVSAPTSSGKTMVGELAAMRNVLNRRKALFLLPLKALVADKHRHFQAVYGPFGVRTIEATGETDDITPLLRGHYDIALLTYEKFAAIVLSYPHILLQVGVVIQHVNMRGMVVYQKGIIVTAHEPRLIELCELSVEHPGLDMTGAGMNRGWFYRVNDDGMWTREASPEQCNCGNDKVHLRHISALHIVEAYLATPEQFS